MVWSSGVLTAWESAVPLGVVEKPPGTAGLCPVTATWGNAKAAPRMSNKYHFAKLRSLGNGSFVLLCKQKVSGEGELSPHAAK